MKRWILYNKTDGTSWLVSPSGDKVQLTPELNFPDEHCDVVDEDNLEVRPLDLGDFHTTFQVPLDYDPANHTVPNDFVQYHNTPDGAYITCPVDPWPILPERSDKQRRDDLIAVSWLLYNINHEQTKLIAQGKIRPLAYNPVEPSRTISRKSDGA